MLSVRCSIEQLILAYQFVKIENVITWRKVAWFFFIKLHRSTYYENFLVHINFLNFFLFVFFFVVTFQYSINIYQKTHKWDELNFRLFAIMFLFFLLGTNIVTHSCRCCSFIMFVMCVFFVVVFNYFFVFCMLICIKLSLCLVKIRILLTK